MPKRFGNLPRRFGSRPKSLGSLPEPNWFRLGACLGSDVVRIVKQNCRQSEPSLKQLGSDKTPGTMPRMCGPPGLASV